jgi:exonuclease III
LAPTDVDGYGIRANAGLHDAAPTSAKKEGVMGVPLRRVLIVASLVACLPGMASGQSFKIAAYNIQSGKGEPGLAGRPRSFVDTSNCADSSQPLNAWGIGFVQDMLRREIGSDPAIIALALSEAWESVCGSPERVRQVLGWTAATRSHNGVALLARYGFAGPDEWLQLDTSLNDVPADTMWVVRAPVCLDAACTRSVAVFASHWYASPPPNPSIEVTYERQAQQTIDFMRRASASPHVLVGDLNVWEDPHSVVCRQNPSPYGLDRLRSAGYTDVWVSVHGAEEGYTGMTNRPGCGVPEGYVWKRIDYAWSSPELSPRAMTRFGVVTPGDEAPSDHYGIVAEFALSDLSAPLAQITDPAAGSTVKGTVAVTVAATDDVGVSRVDLLVDGTLASSWTAAPWQFSWNTTSLANGQHALQAIATDRAGNRGTSPTISVTVSNPSSTAAEIVLYARAATTIAGNWRRVADPSAAGGEALLQPDAGAAKIDPALTSPANFFELTFDAVAGKPYHLWLRLRAERNSYANDSVHVQFEGAVNGTGQAVYRIGSTNSMEIVLEDCGGCGVAGWGWQDNGYGTLGPDVYFNTTGRHIVRIQGREDGVAIDQIVLSPALYRTQRPGSLKNDGTILSGSGTTAEIVLHARTANTIAGRWRRVADASAAGGEALWQPDAGTAKTDPALVSPGNYFELTFDAVAGRPYHLWLRMRAERNFYGNDSVHVQFAGAVDLSGQPVYQIGSTNSMEVVLEDCSACGVSGWGWQDNGYGRLGSDVYFNTTGRHTIRIQTREDGALLDQIVLSPATYRTAAPGALKNDTVILSPSQP